MARIQVTFEIETSTRVSAQEIAEGVGFLIKYGPYGYGKPKVVWAEDLEAGSLGNYELDSQQSIRV